VGALVGGIVGLLAGPVGWLAGGGALVGAFSAKAAQHGFPIERVKELGEGLKPGTSAVVAVVEHKWVLEAERILQQQNADYMIHALSEDIATQLGEGKDVAYTAVATEQGLAAARLAGNESDAEYSRMVATSGGTYLEGMRVTGNEVDAGVAIITDRGIEGVSAHGTLQPASQPPAPGATGGSTSDSTGATAQSTESKADTE
jgi:hypothetical protein